MVTWALLPPRRRASGWAPRPSPTTIAATAAVIDPEIFIIGGGVSKAGQVLVDRVQGYFKQYAWPGIRNIEFALATLGNDAGIYGAAYTILNK